jgi:hypothetical protein
MSEPLLAIDVEGCARGVPLAPSVLYVEGEAARALARRLAARLGERPGPPTERGTRPNVEPASELSPIDPRLVGVASREGGYLLLSGPCELLPWCDGARYFGIDPAAPRLRLSTTHAPRLADGTPLSPSLLERALVARHAAASGALVVMRGRVIALGAARPLDHALLLEFAGAPA